MTLSFIDLSIIAVYFAAIGAVGLESPEARAASKPMPGVEVVQANRQFQPAVSVVTVPWVPLKAMLVELLVMPMRCEAG